MTAETVAVVLAVVLAVALALLVVAVAGDQHLAAENRRLRIRNLELQREAAAARLSATSARRRALAAAGQRGAR